MTSTTESSQSSAALVNLAAPLSAPSSNPVDSTSARACDSLPSLDVLDCQVRRLLNELTTETFDPISDQIIEWANKSEKEKDGKMLDRVVQLVFERAVDSTASPEIYARLCHKTVERVSEEVQEHGVQDAEGKPIMGGQLFKQLLLNSCQDFSGRIWTQKEVTAVAFKAKNENNRIKEAEEVALYSDEYYAAQKARRQYLGLVRFITELFKLQMLTEHVMHEHLKKLLGNAKNPEEEDVEGLCAILTKVGSTLDTQKAHARMDVYFQRIEELAQSPHVSFRMQSMLQNVIKLRGSGWMIARSVVAPTTTTQTREVKKRARKEKKEKEREGKGKGKAAESKQIAKVEQAKVSSGVSNNRTPKKYPPPLDLSNSRPSPSPPPFPVSTVRTIDDLEHISYPDGILGPRPELNTNAREGKFRYDRDFLMQFQGVCQGKPDLLPSLSTVGLQSIDRASQALT